MDITSTVEAVNQTPRSLKIATIDPAKKKMPDNITGIQNALPTAKCLIACSVFQLTTLRIMAMDARGTSRIRTMLFHSSPDFLECFFYGSLFLVNSATHPPQFSQIIRIQVADAFGAHCRCKFKFLFLGFVAESFALRAMPEHLQERGVRIK